MDEDLTEYYDMLASMAEEIIDRTGAFVRIDYKKDTLTIQLAEEDVPREAKDFIEQYKKAMPKISIFYKPNF